MITGPLPINVLNPYNKRKQEISECTFEFVGPYNDILNANQSDLKIAQNPSCYISQLSIYANMGSWVPFGYVEKTTEISLSTSIFSSSEQPSLLLCGSFAGRLPQSQGLLRCILFMSI